MFHLRNGNHFGSRAVAAGPGDRDCDRRPHFRTAGIAAGTGGSHDRRHSHRAENLARRHRRSEIEDEQARAYPPSQIRGKSTSGRTFNGAAEPTRLSPKLSNGRRSSSGRGRFAGGDGSSRGCRTLQCAQSSVELPGTGRGD